MVKYFFTLCLLFLLSIETSSAQMTMSAGAGITSKIIPTANLDMTYRFAKMNVGAGFVIPATDKVTEPNIFYLKAGKVIAITNNSGLNVGGGISLCSKKQFMVSKLDAQYSFYKRTTDSKLLLFASYQKKMIGDGEIFTSIVYTGHSLYVSTGFIYLFIKKKCK